MSEESRYIPSEEAEGAVGNFDGELGYAPTDSVSSLRKALLPDAVSLDELTQSLDPNEPVTRKIYRDNNEELGDEDTRSEKQKKLDKQRAALLGNLED